MFVEPAAERSNEGEKVTEKTNLVFEQLKKTKANASIWELLMHSRVHRDTLIKALENMNIIVDNQMVSSLNEKSVGAIMIIDNDLALKGKDHSRALFVWA